MILGRFAKRMTFLQGRPTALQAMLWAQGEDGRFRAQENLPSTGVAKTTQNAEKD